MKVGVLGPLLVTAGGKQLPLGGPKQRAVLALLVARPGTVVSVATIIDGVWGDSAPGAVESSLQSYVSHLRSDAGLAIERVGDGYRLDLGESATIDALEFERSVDRANDLLDGDPEGADIALRGALALWRGRPYSDLPAMSALGPEVARLENLHRSARELSVDVSLALGDNEAAIRTIDELTAEDPFRESLRSKHMIALYRLGRQAAALSVYQTVRRQLIDEFGIEPGPDLQAVEHQILVHDPALRHNGSGTRGSAPARNPYKGAAAFTERDATDFFGRDTEVAQLVGLVSHHRLTLLVGPSGSGKSSLARAGLLPAFSSHARSDTSTWATQVIRPGRQPVAALNHALSSVETATADERLVIIDQFEEIYSLVGSSDRRQFIDLVLSVDHSGAGDRHNGDRPDVETRILLALRADFFHLPLLDGRLGPRLRPATMALSVPSAADLARAVEGPAGNVGLVIDPTVTAQIVADVEGQAAALPLLQFTLTELAQSADDGRIDLASYRRHGGVLGAIGQRAAAVYNELDEQSQQAARSIFLNLVTVVDENTVVRRPVRRTDLELLDIPDDILNKVLNRFGGVRLLAFDHDPTTGAATVEVSHEAVLQEWSQLAGWIDDRRQNLVVRRRFQTAFDEWVDSSQADDFLPDRTRLSQFREWASDPDNALTPGERTFLERAVERFDHLEHRRRGRRRLLTGSSVVVAVVMSVLALLAAVSSRDASRQSDLATARALTSDAEANIAVDPELAIMLAAEAVSLHDDPSQVPSQVTDVLRRALAANKVMGQLPGGQILAVDLSGEHLYTRGDNPGELAVWDPMTQQELAAIPVAVGGETGAQVVAVDTVGSNELVVRLDHEDQVKIMTVNLQWDGEELAHYTFDERLDLSLEDNDAIGTVVSPDGRLLATTAFRLPDSDPRVIKVWDLENRDLLYTLDSVRSEFPAFSPDSRLLALSRLISDPDPTSPLEAAVVDATTGEDEFVLSNLSIEPWGFSFSPDQTQLAYANPNQVGVADLTSRQEVWSQSEVSRTLVPLWSPDGEVITAGNEGVMARISVTDGSLLEPVLGDRGLVHDYEYVAGTDLLAIAGTDRVTLIDTSSRPRSEIAGFASPMPTTWSLAFDSTGEVLLQTFTDDYVVQAIDDEEVVVGGQWSNAPNFWQYPVINRDGSFFAGYLGDENRLWATPDMDVTYRSPAEWSIRAISGDGGLVALSREGEPSRLVDTDTGQILHELDVGPYLHIGFFTEDGRHLFTTNNTGQQPYWRIWDTQNGQLVNSFAPPDNESGVAFSPTFDGRHLVTGSANGTVMVYDLSALLNGSDLDDALIRRIEAHDQFIVQISVSVDDRLIVTNAWDEPAKLWELETGRKVAEFGGTGQITSVAFHPTEPHIYLHDNGHVSVHTFDTAELVRIAVSTVTRTMTEEECEQYFGRPCHS
ncbi:MAG: winged helix-turn-helix domain-containing protein [Acidimicrobiia bacterium]|nr:winged helix-turn-helix domain-containing protein [Acidimicrobiia bacterium]